MSFLTDPNLTFHRFSDGTIANDGRKVSSNESTNGAVWTTNTAMDYSTTNPTLAANDSATSATRILNESTANDAVHKRYSTYSSTYNDSNVTTTHNGSTMKLIQVQKDDSSSKQVSESRENLRRETDRDCREFGGNHVGVAMEIENLETRSRANDDELLRCFVRVATKVH
jgi:hypothetical protein